MNENLIDNPLNTRKREKNRLERKINLWFMLCCAILFMYFMADFLVFRLNYSFTRAHVNDYMRIYRYAFNINFCFFLGPGLLIAAILRIRGAYRFSSIALAALFLLGLILKDVFSPYAILFF